MQKCKICNNAKYAQYVKYATPGGIWICLAGSWVSLRLETIERNVEPWLRAGNLLAKLSSSLCLTLIAKDCLSHTGQEQACTRIIWLFVHLFVTMQKMAQYTGKWLLTAP